MESALLTFVLGNLLGFFVLNVDCQQNVSPPSFLFLPFSPPPPPPPPPSPPPISPPPPPPFSLPPPPPLLNPPPPPPPPRRNLRQPPPLPENGGHGHHGSHGRLNPPPKKERLNTGKKLGLMFVGVAVILQAFVVAFLLVKRRQLFKSLNVY